MSVDQKTVPEQADAAARAALRKRVDGWLIGHGVPQFTDPYEPEDRLRFLVLPLVVLVAFDFGAAPKLPALPALLVVPPVVVALGAWARPFVWKLLGRKDEPAMKLSWGRLAGLLAVLVALSAVLVWLRGWPPPWSEAWADFGVILLAELAAMAVFTRAVWHGSGERLARLRRRLVAYTVGAVLFFAFLLALDQSAAINSRQLLNDLVPGEYQVSLAAPALVCTMIIVGLADRVSRAAQAEPDQVSRATAPSTGNASPWAAICYPALPLLVLVLGAQTTVLRESRALGWTRVWLPLVAAVILFATSAAAWRVSSTAWWTTCTSTTHRWRSLLVRRLRFSHRSERPARPAGLRRGAWDRIFQGAGHPLFLAPLLVAALVGYPAHMGIDLGVEVFGWNLVLGALATLMFAIYVFLVWFFVWFGLDHVGIWVLREVRKDVLQIVQGVAGGLPLLLVFAVFFALTAETWEVVVETDTVKFLSLIGLLVALTIGVLFLVAKQQLQHAERQLAGKEPIDDRDQPDNGKRPTPWELVKEQALREEPSKGEHARAVIEELFRRIPAPSGDADLSPRLERRGRVNALVVIAVYQGLVLVPAGIGALLLFWAVGRLAVDSGVAAEWIHGDNSGARGKLLVDALSFWKEPWTRVPLVLAAFSVLYLSVTLLTNKEHRSYFFAAASAALRQRLAVRVAYRMYFDNPAPVPVAQEEEAAAAAQQQHRPAAAGMITPGASVPDAPGA